MQVEPDPNNTADHTDIDMVEPIAKQFKSEDTTSKSTQSYAEGDGQCSPPKMSNLSVVLPVAATNSSSSFSSLPSSPVLPPPIAINASSSSSASSSPSSSVVSPPATNPSSSSSSLPSSPVLPPPTYSDQHQFTIIFSF